MLLIGFLFLFFGGLVYSAGSDSKRSGIQATEVQAEVVLSVRYSATECRGMYLFLILLFWFFMRNAGKLDEINVNMLYAHIYIPRIDFTAVVSILDISTLNLNAVAPSFERGRVNDDVHGIQNKI